MRQTAGSLEFVLSFRKPALREEGPSQIAMRSNESAIELDCVFFCRLRFAKTTCVVVRNPGHRVRDQRERLAPERRPRLHYRRIGFPFEVELLRIHSATQRGAWRECDTFLELSTRQVLVPTESIFRHAERGVRLAHGAVERKRPSRRSKCLWIDIGRAHFSIRRQQGISGAQCSIRLRIAGVERDCLREQPDRASDVRSGTLLCKESPLKHEIVRFHVFRWHRDERRRFSGKPHLQCADYCPRDVILNREHIARIAVVTVRPQTVAGRRVDELSADAKSVAGATHGPFEYASDGKRFADIARSWIVFSERKD